MVSAVLNRLRYGVSETHPAFEQRARWIYAITGAEILATFIACRLAGFTFSAATIAAPYWFVLLCLAGMLLRRYGHPKGAGALEAIALIYGQGAAVMFLLFPLTAISGPLADAQLSAIDQALGFDWLAFAALFAGHRSAQHGLVILYHSFNWQPLLLALMLFGAGQADRGWRFVLAGTIAALMTALLYPFAPAVGTFYHYHLNAADFPKIQSGWQFAPVLLAIKDGARHISPEMFAGIVSFPSYHAAAATMFAWAAWPFRVRWLFVALNVGLAASAIIVGAHYLIDIIAGVVVGAGAIALAARLIPPRSP